MQASELIFFLEQCQYTDRSGSAVSSEVLASCVVSEHRSSSMHCRTSYVVGRLKFVDDFVVARNTSRIFLIS